MKIYPSICKILKFIVLILITTFLEFNFHIGFFANKSIDVIKEIYPNFYFIIPYFYYILIAVSFLGFLLYAIINKVALKRKVIYQEVIFYLMFYIVFIKQEPIFMAKTFLVLTLLAFLVVSFLHQKTIKIIYEKLKESVYKFDSSLILPLLITLVIRLIVLFNTDNASVGDASARLWQSWVWSEIELVNNKQFLYFLMPNYDWLPLQHYITGITIYFTGDLVWAPRIIIALFSCITIFPLYGLSKILFNKRIGIIACYFFALYASMIRVNVLTLSETPFIFFMLSCIYFLLRYYKKRKVTYLIFSIISLTATCMLRYEGWVLLIAVGAVLFLFFERNHQKWIYFTIPIITITFYIFIVYLHGQSIFRGLFYSDWENLQNFILDGGTNPINILYGYGESFILGSIGVFSLFALKFFRLKTVVKIHVLITSLLLFIFLKKLFNFTLHPQNRYFVQYVVLIIPFISYYTFKCTSNKIRQFVIIILLVTPNFFMVKHKYYDSGRFNFKDGFKESYLFVNENIPKGTFIIDQETGIHDDNHNQAWMAYAQIYLGNENKNKNCVYRVSYEHQKDDYFTFEKLDSALTKSTHLVLFDHGEMATQLNFSDSIESYKTYTFIKLYEFDNNFIYKIKDK